MVSWMLTTIPWGTFMYFTMLGCIHAFGYVSEAKDREAQAARLAAQVAESRLGALRTQLHPHFLFNSLNAITVLVRDKDTAAAARMLDLLSDVLRQVLKNDQAHVVSLAEELAFLERYLAIEQIRFSDRLQVRFDVDESLKDAAVPVFILQPLVENALRHGIAKRAEGGVVEITARRSGESLILTIADNGRGLNHASAEHTAGNGLGLANIRERLTTLFGTAARLDLRPAPHPPGGTVAEVVIPFRRLDTARQPQGTAESPVPSPESRASESQ
jgi:LytS/YehU family sensor histidine kinase